MGVIKKIVDGVVTEVPDDNQMVKTIENGVVVEKPFGAIKKKATDSLLGGVVGALNGNSQSGLSDETIATAHKGVVDNTPTVPVKPITDAGINLEHDDPFGEIIKPNVDVIQKGFLGAANKPQAVESTGQIQPLKTPIDKSNILTPQQEQHIAANNIDLAVKGMQKAIPDGGVAEQYLQSVAAKNNGKLPDNNATINYALNKSAELEDWNKRLSENPDLTQVAVDIARGNDENLNNQISVLEQNRFAGQPNVSQRMAEVKQAGYYYDNMIPPEQQFKYVDELIHDPNTKLIAEKNPAVKQQLDYLLNGGIYERFPDGAKTKILNDVSQEYEREHGSMVFDPSSPYRDKQLNDIADKLYANQPQLKKIVDENFRDNWTGKIDNPTLTSRFAQGFGGAVAGQASSLLDWAGLGPSRSDRIYHNLQNQFNNVSAGETGLKKDLGTAANFAGMISEMALGTKALGAAKAIPPVATNMVLNASTFYDGLKDQYTMMFPDNPTKAEAGATLSTLAFSFAYKAFPSAKLAAAVSKKIQPEVAEVLNSLESGTVSNEVKSNFLTKLKDVTVGTLGKSFEGTAQMAAITAGQNAFDEAVGITPQAQKKYEQNPVAVARNMAIGLAIPSLIQSVGGIGAASRNLNKIADYPMMHEQALNGMLKDGIITQEQYDQKKSDIEHLVNAKQEFIKNGVPETNIGRSLLESLNQKQLLESTPTDPLLLKNHLDKIKESQDTQQNVMNGGNPNVKTSDSKEVGTDLTENHLKNIAKPQPLTPEQEVITEALQNNEIKGVYKAAAEDAVNDPVKAAKFLSDAKDQIGNQVASAAGDPSALAKESFGKTIVDHVSPPETPPIDTKIEETPPNDTKTVSAEITFDNAKEGDVVLHNGKKVTVIGKTKSRGGNDVIEVRKEPHTEDEIRQMALNDLSARTGETFADIEKYRSGELSNLISDYTKRENSATGSYTIDKEQWDSEVKSQPIEQKQGMGAEAENKISENETTNKQAGGEDKQGEQQTTQESEKPPQPPEDKQGTGEGDTELTKIANAVNDQLVKDKFGVDALDGIIGQLQDTDLSKVYGAIKERIQKGTLDPKVTREKVITQKSGDAKDQAVLLYDMAQLKGQEKDLRRQIIESTDPKEKAQLQKQLVDTQNAMMDNALANRYIGRDWHNIGKIRQQWINKDYNIVDMQDEYMASKGITELSEEQKAEIQQYHDALKDLEVQRDKAKEERDKAITENETLKMENLKLQELKDKANNQKRADRGKKSDDAIQKSKDRIQKAKDELKKLRGNLNAGFDPRAAAQIAKIAAEYTYQGVVKLSELVKQVLDTVKDVFPNWTEKDVRKHLFGENIDTEKYFEAGKKYETSSKELQEKIRNYNELEKEFALKKFQWQKDRRTDLMKNRPMKERVIDGILRWQRFAVLTWPPTIAKLITVVAHQLILKPFKFLAQKGWAAILPKSITDKQQVWGNPTWRSLGKYYSEFVRNFSLANLKEQFSGIDTKEILYGDSYKYDEWAAAKGLLEMPGRSHGYIKSFIKNPEFKFAQENIATHYISKMADIENQLNNEKLSEEDKNKLKEEYAKWDITDPDVMERVNKLSLEHGRWAIFMNDNKAIKKFQNFADKKTVGSALIRSELPIVKIPVNYISRSFATKYGLIKAITGSKWMGGNLPSMFEMIYKGTKDMTPEQADLLGKTLTIGSMGASFFVMGYMMRGNVKQNKDGSYDFFGHRIPKIFVHSTELESMFNGVETGNSFDKQGKGKKDISKWLNSFVEADVDMAKNNPFLSMLKYGFLPNVAATAVKSESWDQKIKDFADEIGKKISDLGVPGVAKYYALGSDNSKGFNWEGKSENFRKSISPDILNRVLDGVETSLPFLRETVGGSKMTPYTEKDKKDPTFKYFLDKGVELPNVELSSIPTKDLKEGRSDKKVSEYPPEIQQQFIDTHKGFLKQELATVERKGYVYVSKLKNKDGEHEATVDPKENSTRTKIDDLTDRQLSDILHIAQSTATTKAKQKVFHQK